MSAEDTGVSSDRDRSPTRLGLAEAVTREIAALAEQDGWSNSELARQARLPVRSLSQKIREYAVLDLAEVEALAAALDVDPVQLIVNAARHQRSSRWPSSS